MTNENFYRNQGSPWKTVIPSILQYGGLIAGFNAIASHVSKKIPNNSDHVELFLMGLYGVGVYLLGKGMEYAHRSDALNTSFTHLEETLRKEFKKE